MESALLFMLCVTTSFFETREKPLLHPLTNMMSFWAMQSCDIPENASASIQSIKASVLLRFETMNLSLSQLIGRQKSYKVSKAQKKPLKAYHRIWTIHRNTSDEEIQSRGQSSELPSYQWQTKGRVTTSAWLWPG